MFGFPNQAELQAGTTRAARRSNCLIEGGGRDSCKKQLLKSSVSSSHCSIVYSLVYSLVCSLAIASATAIRNRTNIVLGKPFLCMHGMCSMVATHTEAEPVPEPGLVFRSYVVSGGFLR